MKTNNLSKKSFLTTMILAMSAGMAALKNGGSGAQPGLANGYVGGGSPIFTPSGRKLKGYMRQQHEGRRHSRFYFGKNR